MVVLEEDILITVLETEYLLVDMATAIVPITVDTLNIFTVRIVHLAITKIKMTFQTKQCNVQFLLIILKCIIKYD